MNQSRREQSSQTEVTRFRLALLDDGRRQGEIARAAGITQSRISEYAMGRRPMPPHHQILLSRVLQRDPQDLIGWVDAIEI